MQNITIKPDGINPITNRPYVFLNDEINEEIKRDYSVFGSFDKRVESLERHIARSLRDDNFESLGARYNINKEMAINIKTKGNYQEVLNWIESTSDVSVTLKDGVEFLSTISYVRDWG